jgi:4-amino-4-deoxy-L-arabinose transferase-like glycosyltransferase
MKLPPASWTLAGLLCLYVFAGLFGHDPWKTEDVLHLTLARDLLDSGYIPGFSQAGGAFPAAPLYYWSAALTEFIFGGLLPQHDALRLASGLWTALSLIALYHAGREWYGKEAAAATPILLIGSFGLIVRVHEAQPLLTLLAAESLLLLALARLPRQGRATPLCLALALLLAALGTGISGLLPLLMLCLLPLCFFSSWLRGKPNADMLRHWGAGVLLGVTLIGVAGYLLHCIAPEWLQAWLGREWQGLTDGWHYGGDLREYATLLPWFSWPLWPLAGWSLWKNRRVWRSVETLCQSGAILLPLGAFFLLLFLLPICFAARESVAMLFLPPLALLATPGALTLRRGAANAFDWFSGMLFCVFALFLWVGWSAMVFGHPARLAQRAVELAPGFAGRFAFWPFVLAVLVTLWWLSLLRLPRSPWRCLVRWSAGLITLWLLAVALWLPWIDYGKSYRPLAAALAAQLPEERPACIAEWRLGEAQRASFAYFEQLAFTPLSAAGEHCRWLLIQDNPRAETAPPPDQDWQRVWEGSRPGDRKERFRLYRNVKK